MVNKREKIIFAQTVGIKSTSKNWLFLFVTTTAPSFSFVLSSSHTHCRYSRMKLSIVQLALAVSVVTGFSSPASPNNVVSSMTSRGASSSNLKMSSTITEAVPFAKGPR